jgi:glycosyltransferase involved in cell wall biosynthesis
VANIAVICDREFFKPFDQRVYKEVCSMKRAGHNIEIITPHESTKEKIFEDIRCHCISSNGVPISIALKMLNKALSGEYDLFYCHELDPLIYSTVLKGLTKKPVIWDCHEYLVPMKLELQGKIASILTDLAIRFCAPKVDQIITVDNRLARDLTRFGKVAVIPNYPKVSDFDFKLDKKRNNEIVALYVGSLTEKRGIKVILKSIKKVRIKNKIKLRVAGGFYDEELELWAKEYDKENNLEVEWLGWVDYKELAPIINTSDFGLFMNQPGPRYLKGLPTKIFEYMLMGLPVVSATGPLLKSLILRNKIGLTVDSTNIDSIAKGIEKMIKLKDWEEMGKRGQKLVTTNYCWEAKEDKLLNIINKLTGC